MQKPKVIVSICCITYNHDKFIRECLEGFVMQKTNFNFEVLIHDDASIDNTVSIIREYEKKYPEIIKPIYQRENQYSKGVSISATYNFPRAKGKYIAMCEGDDYWIDPLKLQKQVDFLETDEEYVLCFHKVNILKTDGTIVKDFITRVPENYETQETLGRFGNYIHTPSVVFRNNIKEFPAEFKQSPIGDYFLYMLLAQYGKLKYIEENMAVYREGIGVWSNKSEYFRNFNTAYTHALLISSNFFDNSISSLLLNRINIFLKTYEKQLLLEDLKKLNTCTSVNNYIFSCLNIIFPSNNPELVHLKTSNELLKVVLQRIKKRLW